VANQDVKLVQVKAAIEKLVADARKRFLDHERRSEHAQAAVTQAYWQGLDQALEVVKVVLLAPCEQVEEDDVQVRDQVRQ